MDLESPQTQEEGAYAFWLDLGTRAGLAVLCAGFFAYAAGLVDPLVPVHELQRLWHLPLDRYLAATGAPTGWGWLKFVGRGDYLNFVGIGVLSLVTLVCHARIVPIFLARGERLHAALAIAQVLVLLAAASGLLAGGR
jgi:hypothetical protein